MQQQLLVLLVGEINRSLRSPFQAVLHHFLEGKGLAKKNAAA